MHNLAFGFLLGPSLSASLILCVIGTPAPPTWNWMSLFFLQFLALGDFSCGDLHFCSSHKLCQIRFPGQQGVGTSKKNLSRERFQSWEAKTNPLKSALPRLQAKPTGFILICILGSRKRGLQIRVRCREGWNYKGQASSSRNQAQVELGETL